MSTSHPTEATNPPPLKKRRRKYSADYKQEAVKLAESIGPAKAASDLGIDRSTVSSWCKALEEEGTEAFRGQGNRTTEQAEIVRLRREVATLRMEREILKKATEFFMREQQ
jgi:transposase